MADFKGKISPGGLPRANVDDISIINNKQRQTIIAVTTIDTIEINRFIFSLSPASTADIMDISLKLPGNLDIDVFPAHFTIGCCFNKNQLILS